MAKYLRISYGDNPDNLPSLFDGEVGKFTWSETGAGGVTVSAEPPRPAGQQNPALAALSQSLKSASKAGAAQAEAEAAAPKASS